MLKPYQNTLDDARTYNGSKRRTKKGWRVHCVTCRKDIPMNGAHCIEFGIFQCPTCRKGN